MQTIVEGNHGIISTDQPLTNELIAAQGSLQCRYIEMAGEHEKLANHGSRLGRNVKGIIKFVFGQDVSQTEQFIEGDVA